jgi:hypothetical protein
MSREISKGKERFSAMIEIAQPSRGVGNNLQFSLTSAYPGQKLTSCRITGYRAVGLIGKIIEKVAVFRLQKLLFYPAITNQTRSEQ